MKITIPFEITIKMKSTGKKRIDNNRNKEIIQWLINDLKNLYIPVGDDDTVCIHSIKVGDIT